MQPKKAVIRFDDFDVKKVKGTAYFINNKNSITVKNMTSIPF